MKELKQIDITISATNFSKLLNDNETYFLHGTWGSGKTEFLRKVGQISTKNFITLDFWRVTDERSVISIAASRLLPIVYWALRTSVIMAVVISILMSNIVNLGLSKYLSAPLIAQLAGVMSLTVAVWSFFKIRSDSFYIRLLKNYSFKNKVLIIDDFDRIEPFLQEQIYALFNVLEKKIPIVFVGDYNMLAKNNNKFLQKIISRKVELPFILNPQNIWDEYINDLEATLSVSIPYEFKRIVIGEQRNLREREHFNDYVKSEFFVRKKINHVQPFHQLLVIYVYLFYPEYYNILLYDMEFEFSKKFDDPENMLLLDTPKDILQFQLYKMQRVDSEGYPYPFAQNKQGYFLYEQPLNHTVQELDSLVHDVRSLKRNLVSGNASDFYSYVTNNYSNFEDEKKQSIFVATLELVRDYNDSPLIKYILEHRNEEIMPKERYMGNGSWGIPDKRAKKSDSQIHKEIYETWHKILMDYEFDFSQELYLLQKYSELHFKALGDLFPDIDLSIQSFEDAKRKDYLLLTYLSSKNLFSKVDEWSDSIWQIINTLTDSQYLSFWVSQGVLDNDKGLYFDSIPKNKRYILWQSKRNFEYPNEIIDYNLTIQKMKPRLNKLKSKGYNFMNRSRK